jgi:class 3 adenylate cyclase
MPEATRAAITTILFTDLVDSTELMQRVGDENAQRVFQAHHALLQQAVGASGGRELQWMGDGLMVAFASAADAVRCAIAMQQAARRDAAGEQLRIRVGLNVGETLQQETGSGYFGTPVVVAKRLCDRAEPGQILCSATVVGLLSGRQAFRFRELGSHSLKGIAEPVAVCEVLYEAEPATALLARTPFVGRLAEVTRLAHGLELAEAGGGGLVMVVGEPGIGKTRMLEEFAASARERGARVLWGSCYEGEWAPPYGPFAEAIAGYAGEIDGDALRKELGPFGGAVAKLVPELKQRIPDLPELPPLQPDEERQRLLDAVTRLLAAAAENAPLLLVLDDLHWADRGTVSMLRHLARCLRRERLLMVGAYRDVELDRKHPLADALAALRREAEYQRIALSGLGEGEVGTLISRVAAQEVPEALVRAIAGETEGNPFFIREVLLHLVEGGKLYRAEGRWTTDFSIQEMGIPEGVREVIGRRLSRLSDEANRLLGLASGFGGAFHFDVAAHAAGMDEAVGLDALDEALEAQLLRPASQAESYEFSHALIRHTLYAEMNPSRQVRLHRRIAEAMEAVYAGRAAEHAGEIAQQYHRSAVLPGAERGAAHCLAAGERAEGAAAHEEAAQFLRMALELLPESDPRRPRALARLGLALAWSDALEEAARVAIRAGESLAAAESGDTAADYLADAADAIWGAAFSPLAWRVAREGLRLIGTRRDLTWVRLTEFDLTRREAEDPDSPGILLDTPERRELSRIAKTYWRPRATDVRDFAWTLSFETREEVLRLAGDSALYLGFFAGEYRRALAAYQERVRVAQERGQIRSAALGLAIAARMQAALGDLRASGESSGEAEALAARVSSSPFVALQMAGAPVDQALARGEGFGELLETTRGLGWDSAIENRWVLAAVAAFVACFSARAGRQGEAMEAIAANLTAIERAPGWALNYTFILHSSVDALWALGRADHAELLERNLREKTLAGDFRYPACDARLTLARLCALTGRVEEAEGWFEQARTVLEQQGARPLRAVADLDQASMYLRRGAAGDRARALALLERAIPRMRELEMTGWLRQAEALA